jgi:hypothetical protein
MGVCVWQKTVDVEGEEHVKGLQCVPLGHKLCVLVGVTRVRVWEMGERKCKIKRESEKERKRERKMEREKNMKGRGRGRKEGRGRGS